MIVDSATPMFTTEFNIIGGAGQGLPIGGALDNSLLMGGNGSHHQGTMINEWNPMGSPHSGERHTGSNNH